MPINVQGPDGQKYEFPDGTDPAVMKSAMAKRYPKPAPAPVAEQDIPYADMAPKKPINIDAALDGGSRNAVDIVADRFKRQAEVGGDFERKAMAERANQAGWDAQEQAAKQANGMSPIMRAMTGPAFDMSRQAGEKAVYNDAGVMTSADAMGVNILNSQALGAPGFASQDFRDKLRQAHIDQPGASMAGEIAGMVGPGEAAFSGTKAAYNATLKPLITKALPKGGSKIAQATRFGIHGAEQAGTWAGQNALYRGTTGASVDAAMEGRAPTFEDVKSGAMAGATDPINLAGPAAFIGLNRALRFVGTGGRTSVPQDRADFASSLSGRAPGSGNVLNAEQVGPVDPLAEKQLLRLLGDFPRKDVAAALDAFENAAQGITDDALLPTRLKDVFVEYLGDGARGPIDDFLKGAGNSTGAESARTVARGVAEDAKGFSQFAEDSLNKRFGSANRFTTSEAAKEEMKRIGQEGYEPILAKPIDQQAAARLRDIMNGPGMNKLREPLDTIAAGEGINLDTMMAREPLRAAHWMQSKARQLGQNADPAYRSAYGSMRTRLLGAIEDAAPEYKAIRKQYGDEFSNEAALTFGDRFVSMNGSSITGDEMKLGQMLKELDNMTPIEHDAAMLSIRDSLKRSMMRKTEGGSPRMASVMQEPTLAALERLGPEGTAFANDVRAIGRRLDDPAGSGRIARNEYISTAGPNSTNKAEAIKKAHEAVSNPLIRRIGETLQALGTDAAASAVTGGPTPIMSARLAMHSMGQKMAKGRQGKINSLTDLLMRDVGKRPRAAMSGDPVAAANPKSLSESMGVMGPLVKNMAKSDSGMVTPDAASALSVAGGAGTGASMAGDVDGDGKVTWKDRAAGAAAGAAVGYGLKKGIGATSNALFTNQVMAREGARASRMASEAIASIPKPTRPGQPMTGAEADDLLTARLNEVLAKNRIDPRDFYAGTAKIDQKKFAPMQEAERLVLEDMKALGYGPPADAEWLRAIRTFSPEQYNKWQATGARDMVSKFRQVQGKEMSPEIPPFEGPRVIDSPGRSMVKPRPSNDTKPPKIKSDIPLGTPAKGKTKLPKSLDEMMAEPVPMQGIAKATGDKGTLNKATESEALAMVNSGKTSDDVFKKTGIHVIEYGGKRMFRRFPNRPDVTPDQVRQDFYSAVNLPRDEQPKWVQGIVDEAGPLVLKDGKKPLVLDKPLKGPVRGAGLLAIGGAGAVAAGQGPGQPRNDKGQFTKAPADNRKLMNRALATQRN